MSTVKRLCGHCGKGFVKFLHEMFNFSCVFKVYKHECDKCGKISLLNSKHC